MKPLIDYVIAPLVLIISQIMHWMPEIAALLTAIWYGIRLYEWLKKKRANK